MIPSIWRYWTRTIRAIQHSLIMSWEWWRINIPFWLSPGFYVAILILPFRWFIAAWYDRRLKNLILGIPAIAMLLFLAVVFQRIQDLHSGIGATYWENAQAAIIEKDYSRAEMLLARILQDNLSHVEDARYGLATLYEETGNTARAELLFNELAPDDRRGYRDAHRRLAMILAETINERSTADEIKRLRWHLDSSMDTESTRLALAWGRYSVATGDLESGRRYLEIAAAEFPELWFTLGDVNLRLGNTERAISSYEKATQFLSMKLEGKQDDRTTRVDYATVLIRLGRLDEAKVILEDGLQRDPKGDWHKLLAALYMTYHDLLASEGSHEISELLEPIAKSLEHEPNFGPALESLMAYASAQVDGNGELKKILARVVAQGKQPALAHLALGNLCWKEGDTDGALFHFERSFSINPKLTVVMNNLAWLVSHHPVEPDLGRSMAMINSALHEEPENGSFLDTRGTIHMMMGHWDEALDDFEKALTTVKDQAAVHGKLASIYEKLGRREMAEQHRLLEQESRYTTDQETETKWPLFR